MVNNSISTEEPQPLRKIGFFEFIFINVGLTIGAGTLVFVPMAASIAGSSVLLLLFIDLIISLVVVASMAEIATIFPYAGGPIYSIRYGFSPRMANFFLMVMLLPMLILILGAAGTESLSFAYYVKYLIPALAVLPDAVIACFLVAALTIINIIGVKVFSRVQFYIVAFMFAALLVWGALSIPYTQVGLFSQPFFTSGITPLLFLMALGVAYWAFVGTEFGGTMGGEVKYPITVLPKGLIISVLIVFLVNAWVIGVSLGLAPGAVLGSPIAAPIAAATKYAGAGALAIAVIALAAAIGAHPSTVNTDMSEMGRAFYGAAKEGTLPKWFAHLSRRYKTPVNALIFTAILACAVIVPNLVMILGAGAAVMALVLYVVVMLSIIMLKRRRPSMERPFKVHMVLPILAIVFSVFIAVGLTYYIGTQVAKEMAVSLVMGEVISIALAVVFVAIGVIIYFISRKTMEVPLSIEEFKQKMKVDEDETIPEEEWTELRAPMRATGVALKKINRQYHIMLAVCLSLIAVTAAFAAYIYFI